MKNFEKQEIEKLEKENQELFNFCKILHNHGIQVVLNKNDFEILEIHFHNNVYIPSVKNKNEFKKNNFDNFIMTAVIKNKLPENILNDFNIDKRAFYQLNKMDKYPMYTKNENNILTSDSFNLKHLENKLKKDDIIPQSAILFLSNCNSMFNMFAFNRMYHFSLNEDWLKNNGFKLEHRQLGKRIFKILF